MKIKTSRKAGFTLVEIMIVVAIIGLLAAIAIPNFVRARQTSQTNACINNLRQIDGAQQQWALEQGKQTTDTVVEASIAKFLGRDSQAATLIDAGVKCPVAAANAAQGGYTLASVGVAPVCKQVNASTHNAVLP